MRQRNIKKHFKFHNLSEIFYCGMTRLRNANLSVFMQCQYTKIILKRKNIGQSLLKKHSKIRNFDEIFYCGLTRLKNTNLDYTNYTMSVHKSHFKKERYGTESV